MSLIMVACEDRAETHALQSVRERADLFLHHLRSDQWDQAARFVAADPITLQRMDISADATSEARLRLIASWLETLYRRVKPGEIYTIDIDYGDPDLALVTYVAGDFDTFHMRLTDGKWMYTLDGRNSAQ